MYCASFICQNEFTFVYHTSHWLSLSFSHLYQKTPIVHMSTYYGRCLGSHVDDVLTSDNALSNLIFYPIIIYITYNVTFFYYALVLISNGHLFLIFFFTLSSHMILKLILIHKCHFQLLFFFCTLF